MMKNKLYKAEILFKHLGGETSDTFHLYAKNRFHARMRFRRRMNSIERFKCLRVSNIRRCTPSDIKFLCPDE